MIVNAEPGGRHSKAQGVSPGDESQKVEPRRGVRISDAPSGLLSLRKPFPGLTPWALLSRPAGFVLLFLSVTLLALSSSAQQAPSAFARISYQLSMPVPITHLFHVAITVETPAGDALPYVDFQMPRWQPGRYSVSDFAKNVQEFSAKAGEQALPFEKTDDQTWRVQTRGNRTFTIGYKVFGNDLSGTYAQLDVSHANYNGGELFMYVVGHKQDPVQL